MNFFVCTMWSLDESHCFHFVCLFVCFHFVRATAAERRMRIPTLCFCFALRKHRSGQLEAFTKIWYTLGRRFDLNTFHIALNHPVLSYLFLFKTTPTSFPSIQSQLRMNRVQFEDCATFGLTACLDWYWCRLPACHRLVGLNLSLTLRRPVGYHRLP